MPWMQGNRKGEDSDPFSIVQEACARKHARRRRRTEVLKREQRRMDRHIEEAMTTEAMKDDEIARGMKRHDEELKEIEVNRQGK